MRMHFRSQPGTKYMLLMEQRSKKGNQRVLKRVIAVWNWK